MIEEAKFAVGSEELRNLLSRKRDALQQGQARVAGLNIELPDSARTKAQVERLQFMIDHVCSDVYLLTTYELSDLGIFPSAA